MSSAWAAEAVRTDAVMAIFRASLLVFMFFPCYKGVCVAKNGLFEGRAGGMYLRYSGLPVILWNGLIDVMGTCRS